MQVQISLSEPPSEQLQLEDSLSQKEQYKRMKKEIEIDSYNCQNDQKSLNQDNYSQSNSEQEQDSQEHQHSSQEHWSAEVVEPAIKSMSFRTKRGTRMKELIKGKSSKDVFWDKYQNYFGGDINRADQSEDQQDYEASSSGRDEFDSDFDLTDSYAGKRGRKKGSKLKRKNKRIQKEQKEPKVKGKRGRKKKIVVESQEKRQNQNQQPQQGLLKRKLIEDYLLKEVRMWIIIEIQMMDNNSRQNCEDRTKELTNSKNLQQTIMNKQDANKYFGIEKRYKICLVDKGFKENPHIEYH